MKATCDARHSALRTASGSIGGRRALETTGSSALVPGQDLWSMEDSRCIVKEMSDTTRIILRLLVFFWYSIMWVIATVKWIPDAVGSVTDEDLYKAMLSLGVSITLLVPIYFIFRVGGRRAEEQ